jgi:hypothetical protein
MHLGNEQDRWPLMDKFKGGTLYRLNMSIEAY